MVARDSRPPLIYPQAATAGILAGVSDILAQRIADRGRPLNWRRTAAWALFGAAYNGPSMHFWQGRCARGGA